MSTAVIVGRFQTDRLTEGHIAFIDKAKELNNEVIILLGTRDTPATNKNPLSFDIRKSMIHEKYGNILIKPLPDNASDVEWSKNLDKTIKHLIIDYNITNPITLYCGRDGFKSHYHGEYPVEEIETGIEHVSATTRRKEIKDTPTNNADFRAGIIYAIEKLWPRTYLTIDIGLVKLDEHGEVDSMLVGKKPGSDKWQLPGGFVDNTDVDFEQAVRRELREESGLSIEGSVDYVGNYLIPDWRIRDIQDKSIVHRTVLYTAQYCFGAPVASDDLMEVQFVDFADLKKNIHPIHKKLVNEIIDFYLDRSY